MAKKDKNNSLVVMNGAVVKGSINDVVQATGQSSALVWMNLTLIAMCDTSISMGAKDADSERSLSRYKALCNELGKLQNDNPGEVGVISFSDDIMPCPGGVPTNLCQGTKIYEMLIYAKSHWDGDDKRLVLISDGEPEWGSEDKCFSIARTFKTPIETIFIGPAGNSGEKFLRELAALTGGSHQKNYQMKDNQLAEKLTLLLPRG